VLKPAYDVGVSDTFYQSLVPFEGFTRCADLSHYRELPDDWLIALSDVRGSTAAIKAARYRQVTMAGAATITAVLNAVAPLEVPFVFGGDGATLCVPASAETVVRRALAETRAMALAAFGLDMRVALVPVSAIHRDSPFRVLVARYRSSPHYDQAMFMGGGLAHADALIKSPAGERFIITDDAVATPDVFKGLQCRWSDVAHPEGDVLALLVLSKNADLAERAETYRRVLEDIHLVYDQIEPPNPVTREGLKTSLSPAKLSLEAGAHTVGMGRLARLRYHVWIFLAGVIGRWVVPRGSTFAGVDWGQYSRDLVNNTDYRKIDDVLRFILPANAARRNELVRRLELRRENGELFYGVHVGETAVMACVVFNYVGAHVHFVDSSNGGYTAAATMLKAQIREAALPTNQPTSQ